MYTTTKCTLQDVIDVFRDYNLPVWSAEKWWAENGHKRYKKRTKLEMAEMAASNFRRYFDRKSSASAKSNAARKKTPPTLTINGVDYVLNNDNEFVSKQGELAAVLNRKTKQINILLTK